MLVEAAIMTEMILNINPAHIYYLLDKYEAKMQQMGLSINGIAVSYANRSDLWLSIVKCITKYIARELKFDDIDISSYKGIIFEGDDEALCWVKMVCPVGFEPTM